MHPASEHTGPVPTRPDIPNEPPPGTATRPPADTSILRLGRGLVWGELVRQMEAEQVIRLQRQAAGEVGYPVAEAA